MLLSLVGDDAGRDVFSRCRGRWMVFCHVWGGNSGTNCVGTRLLYMFYGVWWCFFPDQWDERPSETRILKKGVRCSTGFAMLISFLLDRFAIHHHLDLGA